MKRLALDFGTVRIGIAASDEDGTMAFARTVLQRRGAKKDIAAIERLVEQEAVAEVVVGLPLEEDGAEGERAAATRRFVARLEAVLSVPVALCDERYSTLEAAAALREMGLDSRRARFRIDAEAARNILQRYLDSGGADTADVNAAEASDQ